VALHNPIYAQIPLKISSPHEKFGVDCMGGVVPVGGVMGAVGDAKFRYKRKYCSVGINT
jgi:hypothetical protein